MDNVCNRCLFAIPSKVRMAEEQEYLRPRDYFGGKFMAIRLFSEPVGVLSIECNPIQVLLIRSDPVRVLSIRSDPIRCRFCDRELRRATRERMFMMQRDRSRKS